MHCHRNLASDMVVTLGLLTASQVGFATARGIISAGTLGGDFRFLAAKIVQPVAAMYAINPIDGQFAYPPTMPLLMWPFAHIGGMTGYGVFIILSAAALFVACARHLSPVSLVLLAISFPFINVVLIGQPTFAVVALTLIGLSIRNRTLAGCLFALAAGIKPQLVALVPLYLIVTRDWRALGFAAVAYGAIVGMSVLAFGVDAWTAWPATIASYRIGIFKTGVIRWVIAPIGMAERSGISTLPVTVVCAVGALMLAFVPYRKPIEALFGLTLAAILILPYGCPDNAVGLMPLVVERLRRAKLTDVLPYSFMFPWAVIAACFFAVAEITGRRGKRYSESSPGSGLGGSGPISGSGGR